MTEVSSKNFVPRVNQLDAIHLNADILRLFRENLLENLQNLSPVLFTRIQPELDILIHSAVWFGSVHQQLSTFGQQLLLLSYDPDKLTTSRLCLHFALTVLPKYVKSNAEQRFTNKYWIQKFVSLAENATLVLSVLNFLRFLKTGKRPSLIDFMLSLDYISLRSNQRRDIGYKYMTRELIWGGFMELLGLILPIINVHKLKRLLKTSIWGKTSGTAIKNVEPTLNLNSVCVYCGDRPTLPHHIGCGHVYCYYCIQGNVITDADFQCIICGNKCGEVHPVAYKARSS